MPNPFAITAASNTVLLDRERRGEASFSVSNLTGRPLRVRARLSSDNAEVLKWLTLAGETERNFAIAATEQYTVNILAPAGAPPGSYTFRLDALNVENPDDEFTEGPAVSFTVPAPPPPPPPFPWWILVAALVVLLLVGGGVGAYVVFFSATPTPGPTLTPTAPPGPTATPTAIPPTETPTPTPLFAGGFITFVREEGGGQSLYALGPDGAERALVTGATGVTVLDYAPTTDRLAIFVNRGGAGGQESVVLVRPDGSDEVELQQGWGTVRNADFTPDGQILIVQAETGGAISYYHFRLDGTLLNVIGLAKQPAG
jgi:hypothetical protein